MTEPAFQPAGPIEPKRFLFTFWPFVGHIYPQISIANALRAQGHDVAFYTGERFRTFIENEGFSAFPFQHIDEDRVCEIVESWETGFGQQRPGPRSMARSYREWLVETIPGQMIDLELVIQNWHPHVIVTDLTMWAPIAVYWERRDIPVAISSSFMGPFIPGPDAPPWGLGWAPPHTLGARLQARMISGVSSLGGIGLRRRLDALRESYGLGPLKCTVDEFSARLPLYLVGNIPELDYNRHDLPSSVAYVGACVWNRPNGTPSTDWLDELPTDYPWVYVTESTLRHDNPFLLRAASDGLANQRLQVILTTGKQRDLANVDVGPAATNVTIRQWVSQSDLLHRCSVVVTSGGAGTIIGSLKAGVPLVIVPTAWEKRDNARRVVDVGAGVVLSPRRCTPERLRAAVEEVLNNPRYRNNAAKMAQRFAEAPGPTRAAELLVTLAATARRSSGSVKPSTAFATYTFNSGGMDGED